jgi:hypothetical protein
MYCCVVCAGYSLNALVDFPADDPIEVIKHLIIGSEGTLGFVSQATYNTVPGRAKSWGEGGVCVFYANLGRGYLVP